MLSLAKIAVLVLVILAVLYGARVVTSLARLGRAVDQERRRMGRRPPGAKPPPPPPEDPVVTLHPCPVCGTHVDGRSPCDRTDCPYRR